jgi:hypothetical protein
LLSTSTLNAISGSATTTGGGGVGVTGVDPPSPPLLQEAITNVNATKTKQNFFIPIRFILKQIYIKSVNNRPPIPKYLVFAYETYEMGDYFLKI